MQRKKLEEHIKPAALEVARKLNQLGFKIKTTGGTNRFLAEHSVQTELIKKMHEGRPNIGDAIKNKEINLVINTAAAGKLSQHDDSYIRKTAIKYNLPYITTTAAAIATARGIEARRHGKAKVKPLQLYHAEIK